MRATHTWQRAAVGRGMTAVLALLSALAAHSAPVAEPGILQAAAQWLSFHGSAYVAGGPPYALRGQAVRIQDESGSLLGWHVPLEPEGYIFLQPDDRLTPVRAFSFESNLDLRDVSGNALRALLWKDQRAAAVLLRELDSGKAAVSAAAKDGVAANQAAWTELLAPAPAALPAPTNILVAPLLRTSWDQWRSYNAYCPPSGDTNDCTDGRCPVGCIAVVGAQLMKYHTWPPRGCGSRSYTDSWYSITGTFAAVYNDAYDWSLMRTNYDVWTTNYPPAPAVYYRVTTE